MDPVAPLPRGPWLLLLWSATLMASASASTRADHTILQADPKSNVVLPCEAPEGTDLENMVLEWTRSDLKQSYVFLFRDGRPLLLHQHPHFKNRVELIDPTLRSGDLTIRLSDVGPSDSGVYSCHVLSHSHVKKRSVLGTPSIKTVDLRVRPDHTLQVYSRTSVELPCEAPKGTDLENLVLEWTRSDLTQTYVFMFRDGRPLQDFQHPNFKDRVQLINPTLKDLSLLLHNVSRSDSGQYECHTLSKSHIRKRSVLGTKPTRTVSLTVLGPEPKTVRADPGQDVFLPLDKVDFPVKSLMWKHEDDSEKVVFQYGMGDTHVQHPHYSGRAELMDQMDQTVILRRVQPNDSGTYHAHVDQSQRRTKRDLHQSEPYSIVILKVETSGAVRLEAAVSFMAAVLFSLFLQI